MFRTTKKRSKPSSRRVRPDADDDKEEDTETLNVLQKKKAKKPKANRTTVVRSFEANRKKGGGIGFGGGSSGLNIANEDEEAAADTSEYDKDALTKLLAEQNSYVVPETKHPDAKEPQGGERLAWEQPGAQVSTSSSSNLETSVSEEKQGKTLPEYLSLDSNIDKKEEKMAWEDALTILTGEEALSTMKDGVLNSRRAECGSPLEDLDKTQSEAWEAELIRRAGVTTNASRSSNAQPVVERISLKDSAPTKSQALLSQLRLRIRDTVIQLHDQRSDMERCIERRMGDIESSRAAVQRHESELKEAGSALEFYNQWRNKLCLWVGAVRELRLKVEPILIAFHELEGELSAVNRWQDWEDDMVSVLQEQGLLAQVIGRQPPPPPAIETTGGVDEFGRDVKSQYVMQREKRRSHRQRIHSQRRGRGADGVWMPGSDDSTSPTVSAGYSKYIRGDESDAFVSDGEEETFRARHKALRKALVVALNELEEEYAVLQNLIQLFDEWRQAYPQEYQQCYASLSLADLAGTLVQAELCSLNDPWNESQGYNEGKWTAAVHSALASGTMGEEAVERLFLKCVLPTISDLLVKRGINLTSSRQTRSFSTFVSHLQKLLPRRNRVWEQLRELLTSYIKNFLASIAIPILTTTAHATTFGGEDEVQEALYSATWGQMHRIKKVLLNLFMYWAPLMDNNAIFIGLVLDFISDKFLFLLSSLQGIKQDGLAESPADVFRQVYRYLSALGWLGLPEYMVQAVPIRAAAEAYDARPVGSYEK